MSLDPGAGVVTGVGRVGDHIVVPTADHVGHVAQPVDGAVDLGEMRMHGDAVLGERDRT